MSSSCKTVAALLTQCLLDSECMAGGEMDGKTCLREGRAPECQGLAQILYDCRRQQIDRRYGRLIK
jgi:hypothetical protein